MNRTFTPTVSKLSKKEDGYEKGQRFERYIIDLFNKEFFHLKKWRRSEKFGTIVPIDHMNPDLEMELVFTGKRNYRFGVECK